MSPALLQAGRATSPTTPQPPACALDDPGHTLALLADGDWWLYDVQGSVSPSGQAQPLHGTVRVHIETRQALGALRRALVFHPEQRLAGVPGPAGRLPLPTGLFYFEQDAVSRDLRITGDNLGPQGSDRLAEQPQVFYPGHFGPDAGYDNVLRFGAGGEVANLLRCTGVEAVDTALGRWTAWRAEVRACSPQFGQVLGTDWWRPGLGAPLRFEMRAPMPDGGTLHSAARLRASNRAIV